MRPRTRIFTLFWAAAGVLSLSHSIARADLTPAGIFRLALVDLETVEPSRRIYTRYVSLHGLPEADRESFTKAFVFALNSTSSLAKFTRPPTINNSLIRLDLTQVGWDRHYRRSTIAKLEKDGVNFGLKTQRDRDFFIDIWESIAWFEPQFRATQHGTRGWLNLEDVEKARVIAHTNHLVMAAPWLLTRMLIESQEGGFYSQLLLHPPKETDLYRIYTDIKVINRDNLKRGGAVLGVQSYVALRNRGLEEIPSLVGLDQRTIWRTYDFKDSGIDANKVVTPADPVVPNPKNVYEALGGTAKHDGREIIGTLRNGLHWYFLCDGGSGKDDGAQVNAVPSTIAVDKRGAGKASAFDRNVTNAVRCFSCHGPERGIIPFDDQIKSLILANGIELKVDSKDKEFVAVRTKELEDYYLEGQEAPNAPSGLEVRVALQRASYSARVASCNGLEPGPNSVALVGYFDRYFWDSVDPQTAAREMGFPLEEARQLWLKSGNRQLAVLYAGKPIERPAWDQAIGDAHRVLLYPWDNVTLKGY